MEEVGGCAHFNRLPMRGWGLVAQLWWRDSGGIWELGIVGVN